MRAKKWIERERSDEELVIIILTATGLCHREELCIRRQSLLCLQSTPGDAACVHTADRISPHCTPTAIYYRLQ